MQSHKLIKESSQELGQAHSHIVTQLLKPAEDKSKKNRPVVHMPELTN